MKFYNPPKPILLETYQEVLEEYIHKVSRIPQVRTIATMGSVGAPGLSDLDVIVIVDDDYPLTQSKHLNTTGINDDIFIHGPVVIPVSMIEALPYIIYATNLNTHYGADKIKLISDVPSKDIEILNLAYLIDFSESRLCEYAQLRKNKFVNQRQWATRLWSLTHTYRISQHANLGRDLEFEEIIQNLHEFRASWNQKNYFDESLFSRIFQKFQSINQEVFVKALRQLYSPLDDTYFTTKQKLIGEKMFHFLPKYNSCRHEYREVPIFHKTVRYYAIDAPSYYHLHFQQYGLLPTQHDLEIFEVLQKRATMVKEHWAWLKENAQLSRSMSGYLGARFFPGNKLSTLLKQNIISLSYSLSTF